MVSSEFPQSRRVRSRTRSLNRTNAAGAIRRFGIGPILKLKPRTFRCSGRSTALLAALSRSLSRPVRKDATLAITRSPRVKPVG
jgi:hypothetical protein